MFKESQKCCFCNWIISTIVLVLIQINTGISRIFLSFHLICDHPVDIAGRNKLIEREFQQDQIVNEIARIEHNQANDVGCPGQIPLLPYV